MQVAGSAARRVRVEADLAAAVVAVGPVVHDALGVVEVPCPSKHPAKVGLVGSSMLIMCRPVAHTGGGSLAAMPPVAGRPALTVAPSAWLTMTAGIVIVGSTPPIVIGVPGALLATMTPTARAAWALATFTAKPQTLGRRSRSRRAGKPTNVSQPREAPLPLSASANAPVDPAWLGAGPNAALYAKRNPGVLVDVDVVRRPVTGSVRVGRRRCRRIRLPRQSLP